MAATFVDLSICHPERSQAKNAAIGLAESKDPYFLHAADSNHCYKAIRVAAKESSKALARSMHPEIENKNQQQMLAYREMAEDDLLTKQWVKVELPAEEFPGYKGERIVCAACGEGINFRREVVRDGKVLCRACAGDRYYESA
jgi:formylmethanofuran dehydrogenase subunit E